MYKHIYLSERFESKSIIKQSKFEYIFRLAKLLLEQMLRLYDQGNFTIL